MKSIKTVGMALVLTLLVSSMWSARAILPGGCILTDVDFDFRPAPDDLLFDQIDLLLNIKKEARLIHDKFKSHQRVRSDIVAPAFTSEALKAAIENFNHAVNYDIPTTGVRYIISPYLVKCWEVERAFNCLGSVILDEMKAILGK